MTTDNTSSPAPPLTVKSEAVAQDNKAPTLAPTLHIPSVPGSNLISLAPSPTQQQKVQPPPLPQQLPSNLISTAQLSKQQQQQAKIMALQLGQSLAQGQVQLQQVHQSQTGSEAASHASTSPTTENNGSAPSSAAASPVNNNNSNPFASLYQMIPTADGPMPAIPVYVVPQNMSFFQQGNGNGQLQLATSPNGAPQLFFTQAPINLVSNNKGNPLAKKQKLFACQEPGCGREFNTKFSLKRHQKRHNGDRPFKCPYKQCSGQFAENSTLKRHIRTHTGERPYRCNVKRCNKAFADRTNLRRHLLSHEKNTLRKHDILPGEMYDETGDMDLEDDDECTADGMSTESSVPAGSSGKSGMSTSTSPLDLLSAVSASAQH